MMRYSNSTGLGIAEISACCQQPDYLMDVHYKQEPGRLTSLATPPKSLPRTICSHIPASAPGFVAHRPPVLPWRLPRRFYLVPSQTSRVSSTCPDEPRRACAWQPS